jgi:hypothetical protein
LIAATVAGPASLRMGTEEEVARLWSALFRRFHGCDNSVVTRCCSRVSEASNGGDVAKDTPPDLPERSEHSGIPGPNVRRLTSGRPLVCSRRQSLTCPCLRGQAPGACRTSRGASHRSPSRPQPPGFPDRARVRVDALPARECGGGWPRSSGTDDQSGRHERPQPQGPRRGGVADRPPLLDDQPRELQSVARSQRGMSVGHETDRSDLVVTRPRPTSPVSTTRSGCRRPDR